MNKSNRINKKIKVEK